MSTWDDWERWLHLGGISDEAARPAETDAGASDADAPSTQPTPLEIDDPWGALEVEITPLTEAQREYLRLAAPTVLDELVELGRSVGAGDPDAVPVSDELSAAFDVLDEIDEIDEIESHDER